MDVFYKIANRLHWRYKKYQINRLKKNLKYCGQNVSISYECMILAPGQLELGDNVTINAFTHIFAGGGVKIGSGTMISSNCSISSLTHPINDSCRQEKTCIKKAVTIGQNVWLGMGAIILPGVTIGDHSIVGAGAVVTKDVQPKTIVVGNPAKFLKYVE
jgi:acetyltransferase-like isoleucine patch superfamily enzyme